MVMLETHATTTAHIPLPDPDSGAGLEAGRPESADLFLFLRDVSSFLARNDLPA